MKASELTKEGSELQHKVRSVSDLIRHIKTREEDSETSNYNLFFGAGCSVTSGVRTASELIEEWVYDLHERFNNEPPKTTDEAKRYFEEHQSSWYNKDDAYSSLFEKMYEFPSQRRRFVEREVEKALPAIGYAYLTSLVNNKYFNTIFTTNFDDLLNEAFYQFSNNRPLLCAHDSSIKSVSITSKRPKIIKLHGDYLFDDIKSTLRETESLEQNTKEKLIEFCKEFGLIVVGYSGNDRSVMDVLDFLTKQDNYLKNGVYWCLRANDEINHTLHNLFWKEKVYPVIIDGFDELFAEIHSKIVRNGLDFEASMKNSKLQQIKTKILDESKSLNSNKYIRDDIKIIKEANSKQEISEFISNLNASGQSDGLSLTELRNLLEIEDLTKKSDFEKAYTLAENFYHQSLEVRDKSRYISKLISISDSKGDARNCSAWCDKLVQLDPNNTSYIIKKADHISDLSAQFLYLSEKARTHTWLYRLHNETARSGYNLIKSDPGTSDTSEIDLVEHLDISLKLNPSLSNPAWFLKIDILMHMKNRLSASNETDKLGELKEWIANHAGAASKTNPKDLVSLKLNLRISRDSQDFIATRKSIEKLYELHKDTDIKSRTQIDETINDALIGLRDYDKSNDPKLFSQNFYDKHIKDKDIKNNSQLLLGKSRYFISNNNQSNKAESYFLTALDCPDIYQNFQDAMFLNSCLDNKYTSNLLDVLEENKSKIFDRYYLEFKHEISIRQGGVLTS